MVCCELPLSPTPVCQEQQQELCVHVYYLQVLEEVPDRQQSNQEATAQVNTHNGAQAVRSACLYPQPTDTVNNCCCTLPQTTGMPGAVQQSQEH